MYDCTLLYVDFKHFMKTPDESQNQIIEAEKSLPQLVEEMEEDNIYDKLRIFSALTQFQVKLFKGEPKLVSMTQYCMYLYSLKIW